MNKLNRLHISGFRRLFDVDIDLRPMTVMIGANGVGKSSQSAEKKGIGCSE